MARSIVTRHSKEFANIINFVRAKYVMEGKIPPSIASITKVIANKLDKEELLHDCLIRF